MTCGPHLISIFIKIDLIDNLIKKKRMITIRHWESTRISVVLFINRVYFNYSYI